MSGAGAAVLMWLFLFTDLGGYDKGMPGALKGAERWAAKEHPGLTVKGISAKYVSRSGNTYRKIRLSDGRDYQVLMDGNDVVMGRAME